MVKNLSVYNNWKRSTLDRMTAKFTSQLMSVFSAHLRSILPAIESALSDGRKTFNPHDGRLEADILNIFKQHRRNVVHVAVSDGIREVTPDKKLSTWEQYPIHIPVEETFVSLADKKERDSIFDKIDKIVGKQNMAPMGKLVNVVKKRYLMNVSSVFKVLADDFYKTDDPETTADAARDIIKDIFKKTAPQAQTIFRTETTKYFNDARVNYFQNNTDVDFVQIFAVTDGRISNICECRDKYVIPISLANDKRYKPPFHPNCRSIQSPLDTDLKSNAEEVKKNLGSEFGKVHSDTSDTDFTGRRAKPNIPLPKNWA